MKNLFSFDFVNNTIIASKTTLKKASIPNSPEYKVLLNTFKSFNLETAKEELTNANLSKVIAISAEQQTKVVDMPAAANM